MFLNLHIKTQQGESMKTIRTKTTGIRRRGVLKAFVVAGITTPLALDLEAQSRTRVSSGMLKSAATIRGEEFTEERLKVIEAALQRNLDQFQILRDFEVDDLVEPAPMFVTKRYANEPDSN
jgi:hypothetical protein